MGNRRIALLTCLKATDVCSGAACFSALNQRKKSFERYSEDSVEILGFFHCNGCEADYGQDAAYLEKMDTMRGLNPDAIHIGKCTLLKGRECRVITNMAAYFQSHGILVIRGTH